MEIRKKGLLSHLDSGCRLCSLEIFPREAMQSSWFKYKGQWWYFCPDCIEYASTSCNEFLKELQDGFIDINSVGGMYGN